jgi:hypothetical protein
MPHQWQELLAKNSILVTPMWPLSNSSNTRPLTVAGEQRFHRIGRYKAFAAQGSIGSLVVARHLWLGKPQPAEFENKIFHRCRRHLSVSKLAVSWEKLCVVWIVLNGLVVLFVGGRLTRELWGRLKVRVSHCSNESVFNSLEYGLCLFVDLAVIFLTFCQWAWGATRKKSFSGFCRSSVPLNFWAWNNCLDAVKLCWAGWPLVFSHVIALTQLISLWVRISRPLQIILN